MVVVGQGLCIVEALIAIAFVPVVVESSRLQSMTVAAVAEAVHAKENTHD